MVLVSSKFSALREHSLSCHRKTSIIFSPCISLYIHCFLSTTQKLQDHLLFCRLINSLMHAFFSFYLGCCLTDSPDWKQRHCAAPCLFRAGSDYVTIHQGKSAWDSCFARRTDSLFSFTIIIVRNETVTWFSLQPLCTSTKVSSPPPSLAAARFIPHPRSPLKGTHLWTSCCHFQALLLLLFIASLLRGAFKQTFCFVILISLLLSISAWSFLSSIIPHFHKHWLLCQPIVSSSIKPTI